MIWGETRVGDVLVWAFSARTGGPEPAVVLRVTDGRVRLASLESAKVYSIRTQMGDPISVCWEVLRGGELLQGEEGRWTGRT